MACGTKLFPTAQLAATKLQILPIFTPKLHLRVSGIATKNCAGSDHGEMVRERIVHRVKDGGVGIASMQRCHMAAHVTASLQVAPILIDTKEAIDEDVITNGAFHEQLAGILGAGSFDGGKVGLRYFLENAPAPDDESEDAVWSMQRELAAAITEIQDGAKEILDKITRRRRQLEKKRWTCHAAYP